MFQTTNQLAWHHPFNDAAPSDDAGELPSGALLSGAWDLPMKVQRGAPKKRNCVQLVNITPITLVYDTQITMFNGGYKPTNITVGPHIVRSYPNNGIPSRMRMLRWDNDFVLLEENASKTQCLNLAHLKVAQTWPTKQGIWGWSWADARFPWVPTNVCGINFTQLPMDQASMDQVSGSSWWIMDNPSSYELLTSWQWMMLQSFLALWWTTTTRRKSHFLRNRSSTNETFSRAMFDLLTWRFPKSMFHYKPPLFGVAPFLETNLQRRSFLLSSGCSEKAGWKQVLTVSHSCYKISTIIYYNIL